MLPEEQPDDLEMERGRRLSAGLASIGVAFKLAVISGIVVAAILSIEGVLPWQISARRPTIPPDAPKLSVVSTGRPAIRDQDTPGPRILSTPPLQTLPPGPQETFLGVIIGGVTDPPHVPGTGPGRPHSAPTPFPTPSATPFPTQTPTPYPTLEPPFPTQTPTPYPTFEPPFPTPDPTSWPRPAPSPPFHWPRRGHHRQQPPGPGPTFAPTPPPAPGPAPLPTAAPTPAPTPMSFPTPPTR